MHKSEKEDRWKLGSLKRNMRVYSRREVKMSVRLTDHNLAIVAARMVGRKVLKIVG